ncbi:MAG: glycosyltransferase family 2 protein [Acidobacteria bacterium]|nr:glycosyltransferase family 2 protein [Acidobacteriota bacterium]
MTITAVIPTFNRAALLEQAVASIEADEIIVVDNGSTETIAPRGARVLRLDRNYGFAYAVNRGIEAAQGEAIAIVNNDVVLSPGYLRLLTQTGAWFATGKIMQQSAPDRIDATFDLLARSGCALRAGHGAPASEFAAQRPIAFAPMTAAVFRRELFDRLGLLDESFGSYMEDVEFGLRAARSGYQGVYVPEATALHRGSATLGAWHPETVRLISRNQSLLVAKHFRHGGENRYSRAVIAGQLLWGLSALRRGCLRAWLTGKWQAACTEIPRWTPGDARAATGLADEDASLQLDQILAASETELLRLTQGSAFWRWYAWLT